MQPVGTSKTPAPPISYFLRLVCCQLHRNRFHASCKQRPANECMGMGRCDSCAIGQHVASPETCSKKMPTVSEGH
eukprot:132591-Amphidinium_carterae.1